jgi:hypothetical protein
MIVACTRTGVPADALTRPGRKGRRDRRHHISPGRAMPVSFRWQDRVIVTALRKVEWNGVDVDEMVEMYENPFQIY